MIESTLIVLLKRFDKQHLKDFNNFVRSPFFNTNKAVISLYEYIRKQYPQFSPDKLQKEIVYKKIFGKTNYNDGFLRVLMSNLQSLAEEYLSYTGLSKDPMIKQKYLIDQLSSLGEQKLAGKVMNRELKAMKSFTPKNPDDYLAMHYIAFYKKYFYSTGFVVSKGNKPDESLYDDQKYLIYHFLLKVLANHFYHLNQKQVISYEPKLMFLDEIIIFLENNPEFLSSPLINITFLRVLLLHKNDINIYYRLKGAFYSIFEKLEQKDNFNTISVIINFCQKNFMLTDDEIYLREKLEILKFAVRNNMNSFEKNDGFDGVRFNNIVTTSLELGETGWAENFINEYSEHLEPEVKDYVTGFSKAALSFRKGDLEEAMKFIAKLKNPAAATDKFNLRVLQQRLYYEKNFIEEAESMADSFRHMIQNDKLLPDAHKESYRNFNVNYIKLLSLKSRQNADVLAELREMTISTRPLLHKKWFINKIDELINVPI